MDRTPESAGKVSGRSSDLARRNELIADLAARGLTTEMLAVLTQLSARQIARILPDRPTAAADRPDEGLSPMELREMRREYRADPEAIDWIGRVKPDRRHNGRPLIDADDGHSCRSIYHEDEVNEGPTRDVPGSAPGMYEAFQFGYKCGRADAVRTSPPAP